MRPCAMIYREQPDTPWEPFDFALAEAYTLMEAEKCGQCNNPIWLCNSNSTNLRFQVKTHTCRAARALEEYKDGLKPKDQRAKKDDKKFWGKYYSTEALPIYEDDPMPTRKEFFSDGTIEGKGKV